ncbi:MAG: ATP-binding protein [Telluria sp.]
MDRRELMRLALGEWVTAGHNVLLTGPTGAGKSWLACTLAQYTCRRGSRRSISVYPLAGTTAHPARQWRLRQMAAPTGYDRG